MAGPPGIGAGGPPGMPPGMPPRKRGGRVGVRNQGPEGPRGEDGAGWRSSEKNKTPVQHTDGKADGPNIGRGKPITYAKGGGVARGTSHAIPPLKHEADPVSRKVKPLYAMDFTSRAAPPAKPMFGHRGQAGGKSGVGRLQKAHEAHGGNAP